MAYTVFISSSSKDIDIVRDLADRLTLAGIEAHWANESGRSDRHIKDTNKALLNADEIFFILTPDSIDDPALMFELGAASSARKRVTPVVVGMNKWEVPSLIRSLNYIKYPELSRYIVDLASRTQAA